MSKESLLEFLRKNKYGGMKLRKGKMISISGYIVNWIVGLEEGRYDEGMVRDKFIKLINKFGCVREGDNLGVRLMDYFGIDLEEIGKREEKKIKLEVSLKELGLICFGLEILSDGEEELWEDRIVCENLNSKLVSILEEEDK